MQDMVDQCFNYAQDFVAMGLIERCYQGSGWTKTLQAVENENVLFQRN